MTIGADGYIKNCWIKPYDRESGIEGIFQKCIEKYLQPEDTYITCIFGEASEDRVIQKGVYAKMARGEMVRFMAENHVRSPEEMKGFDRLGYRFCEERSDEQEYVFLKK